MITKTRGMMNKWNEEWRPIHTLMLIALTIMAIGYIILRIKFKQ